MSRVNSGGANSIGAVQTAAVVSTARPRARWASTSRPSRIHAHTIRPTPPYMSTLASSRPCPYRQKPSGELVSSGSWTSTPPAPKPPTSSISAAASPMSSGRRAGCPNRSRHDRRTAGPGSTGGGTSRMSGAPLGAAARSAAVSGSVDPSTGDGGFMTRSMLARPLSAPGGYPARPRGRPVGGTRDALCGEPPGDQYRRDPDAGGGAAAREHGVLHAPHQVARAERPGLGERVGGGERGARCVSGRCPVGRCDQVGDVEVRPELDPAVSEDGEQLVPVGGADVGPVDAAPREGRAG